MNQEEITDNRVIKKGFLLGIYGILERTEKALQNRNFAVAQGALRGAYNGLGSLIYDSSSLSKERKTMLENLNNSVFGVREELVKNVEVKKRNLVEAVIEGDTYKKLDEVKKTLMNYANSWYKS